MRFEYTITVDDLRETLVPPRPDGQPRTKSGQWFAARGLLGWVVFVSLALLILFMLTQTRPPGRPMPVARSEPTAPTRNMWVTLVPNLVPAGMVAIAIPLAMLLQAVRLRRARAAVAANRPVSAPARAQAWVGFLIVSPVALLLLPGMPSMAIPWDPTDSTAIGVGFAPWLVVLVAFAVLGSRLNRSNAERLWMATPSLRRTITVEVNDVGVWTSDGVCDTLHRWPMITRYRETDNLLLLTREDARVLILPKRYVPDEVALRGLIQTHVAEGTFMPRDAAFPVQPVPVLRASE